MAIDNVIHVSNRLATFETIKNKYYRNIQSAIDDITAVPMVSRGAGYNTWGSFLGDRTKIHVYPGIYNDTTITPKDGMSLWCDPGVVVNQTSATGSTRAGVIELTSAIQSNNWGIYGYGEFNQLGLGNNCNGVLISEGCLFSLPSGTRDHLLEEQFPTIQGQHLTSAAGAAFYSDSASSTIFGSLNLEFPQGIAKVVKPGMAVDSGIGVLDYGTSHAGGLKLYIKDTRRVSVNNLGSTTPTSGTFDIIHIGTGGAIDIRGALVYCNYSNNAAFRCVYVGGVGGTKGSSSTFRDCRIYNLAGNAGACGFFTDVDGLELYNTQIYTQHASSKCIDTTDPHTVINKGSFSNKDKSADITVTGEAILVDAGYTFFVY